MHLKTCDNDDSGGSVYGDLGNGGSDSSRYSLLDCCVVLIFPLEGMVTGQVLQDEKRGKDD